MARTRSIASLPCKIVLGDVIQTSFQKIMLSSGVFRRETASGFYPWGNVVSPRKRVAVGLCGWRHGNSFPTPQSAQSHRQMRSIPHCSKAVFFMFLFLIPFTIRQQHIIYAPRNFPLSPCNSSNSVFFERIKKTATTFQGNSRCYFLCFLIILYNEELIY